MVRNRSIATWRATVGFAAVVACLGADFPSLAAPPEPAPMPSLAPPVAHPFGTLADGREVKRYVLEVPGGWRAEITDYGAILTRFLVPVADGPPVDVVLGFDDLEGYRAGSPYFGAICGRVSNRIAGGTFELDGTAHTLAKNNGAHHLHGGVAGFDKKLWKATPRLSERGPAVDFELVSPDGDEGYPGRLKARASYTLTPDGELWVEMSATTDAATIVNMVHHSYWNLAGHASGTVRGHELAVHADRYLPVDAGSIPTGELAAVTDTPFDFRPERKPAATLGTAIDGLPASADGKNPGGVDHDFVVRGWKPDGAVRPVAVLRDPQSGRTLEVLSDMPGLQVYTGNYLDGTIRGKGGTVYAKHAGVCLETQFHPDSVHHPEWPSPRLDPAATYRHTMVHRFTTR
jgi:aldose 1-epimerase